MTEITVKEFNSLRLRNIMVRVLKDLLDDKITYRKANAAANVAKTIIASADVDQRAGGYNKDVPFFTLLGERNKNSTACLELEADV